MEEAAKASLWAREPVRVIHGIIAVALIVGAVAGDLVNALNGAETWSGAALAVGTVIVGELSRSQVSPVKAA